MTVAEGVDDTDAQGIDDPDARKLNQSWPEAEINLMA